MKRVNCCFWFLNVRYVATIIFVHENCWYIHECIFYWLFSPRIYVLFSQFSHCKCFLLVSLVHKSINKRDIVIVFLISLYLDTIKTTSYNHVIEINWLMNSIKGQIVHENLNLIPIWNNFWSKYTYFSTELQITWGLFPKNQMFTQQYKKKTSHNLETKVVVW